MRGLKATIGVLVLALVLAGCGSSKKTTTSSSSGGKVNAAADKADAQKINLKAADLPSGWTSKPHTTNPGDKANDQKFDQCIGVPDRTTTQTADEFSPDFSMGQTTQVSSEAAFVRTEEQAKADLAAIQGPKFSDCFKQLSQSALQGQLPSGTSAGSLTLQQLPFPILKDGTAAYRVSFTVSTAGLNIPVYLDFIAFRAGRGEISLKGFNTGSPLDTNLEKDLANKVAARA